MSRHINLRTDDADLLAAAVLQEAGLPDVTRLYHRCAVMSVIDAVVVAWLIVLIVFVGSAPAFILLVFLVPHTVRGARRVSVLKLAHEQGEAAT